MKELEFKRDSWHYWVAKNWGDVWMSQSETDICSYVRCVIAGLIKALFIFTLIGFMAGLELFSFGDLIYWVFTGAKMHEFAAVMIGVNIGFGLIIGGMYTINRTYEKLRDDEPGFVRSAYRSWKGKYCTIVKFK